MIYTSINNFLERETAMELHARFFDLDSDSEISFLVSHVQNYELLSEKKLAKLEKLFEEIEHKSWDTINLFDNKNLKGGIKK